METHLSDNSETALLALHQALVDRLLSQGFIHTRPVEAAFRAVPRHLFVADVPLEEAYSDGAITTKSSASGAALSSSSQPAIMATMLEQLDLQPGQQVLEIGAGTGYNAALLAHIVGPAGQVITIDIDQDIVDAARQHLAAAGFDTVQVVCADGGYGYTDAAPYDRIILTVGAWDIAPSWWEQLKPGGRLLLPLDIAGQKCVAFEQQGEHLSSLSVRDCGFIRLRGAFADPHPLRVVPLGPDPGLELWSRAQSLPDASTVYGWLIGPRRDWETNIAAALHEIIAGLWMWLALYEPELGRLYAVDDLAECDVVPPLIGLGDKRKVVFTPALLGERGLAALMRPPGQPAPLGAYLELYIPGPPFPLFVRQLGPDESPARRLVARVRDWDAAGRPSSAGMRVRAYRQGVTDIPPTGEGEIVVEKGWTRLLLDWPTDV
jgi:protein-L-isoaspartate(D-aspartate) O-methyltransferase